MPQGTVFEQNRTFWRNESRKRLSIVTVSQEARKACAYRRGHPDQGVYFAMIVTVTSLGAASAAAPLAAAAAADCLCVITTLADAV